MYHNIEWFISTPLAS